MEHRLLMLGLLSWGSRKKMWRLWRWYFWKLIIGKGYGIWGFVEILIVTTMYLTAMFKSDNRVAMEVHIPLQLSWHCESAPLRKRFRIAHVFMNSKQYFDMTQFHVSSPMTIAQASHHELSNMIHLEVFQHMSNKPCRIYCERATLMNAVSMTSW